MIEKHHYETGWEGMLLVVEKCPEHFQVFVYDPVRCEVLYTAERISLDAAKFAAVHFAAVERFGPHSDLKPEEVAAKLVWD